MAEPEADDPPGWGHALRAAGYETVSIGKLHHRGLPGDDHGFSREILPLHVVDGVGWAKALLRRQHHTIYDTAGFAADVGPAGAAGRDDPYGAYDAQVCAASEAWLAEHGARRAADAPWALFVSYLRPHYPLTCPPEYLRLYDPERLPPIRFAGDRQGTHTARFGEIEQRGVALTAKGRALYDRLLGESRRRTAGLTNEAHQRVLAEVFADFPDTEAELRRQGLAFFEYRTTEAGREAGAIAETEIERLIEQGLITARPITYEDFLPVSAAGIFQSNLGGDGSEAYAGHANREAFEEALGAPVTDELTLYAERERSSLDAALTSLGIPPVR